MGARPCWARWTWARRLALHLGTGDGCLDAGVLAPAVGPEVGLTVGRHDDEAVLLGSIDPVLELPGLPGKSVEVVADDRVEAAGLVVGHHLVVGRANLGLVSRGLGLLHVLLVDGPAALGRDLQAVLALPVDGEPVHLAIERYPEVDGGPGLRFSHVYEGTREMCLCDETRRL